MKKQVVICDACGVELREAAEINLEGFGPVRVKVYGSKDGTEQELDLCAHCICFRLQRKEKV
jgi:hypothetical protein